MKDAVYSDLGSEMQSQEPNSMAEEPVRDHIHQAILTLCVLDTTSKKAGNEGGD